MNNGSTEEKVQIIKGVFKKLQDRLKGEVKNTNSDVKMEVERELHLKVGLIPLEFDDFYNIYVTGIIPEIPIKVKSDILEFKEDENKKKKVTGNKRVCPVFIPQDLLDKIVKKKKNIIYYKEMSMEEKEIDNMIDYAIHQSYQNRNDFNCFEIDQKPDFIKNYFSEEDIVFRRIMTKVVGFTRKGGDFSHELDLLENYFRKILRIVRERPKAKLTTSIAFLLKELTLTIFKAPIEDVEILNFFKNRLFLFYNCYRK